MPERARTTVVSPLLRKVGSHRSGSLSHQSPGRSGCEFAARRRVHETIAVAVADEHAHWNADIARAHTVIHAEECNSDGLRVRHTR